jgi:hypothetical protein
VKQCFSVEVELADIHASVDTRSQGRNAHRGGIDEHGAETFPVSEQSSVIELLIGIFGGVAKGDSALKRRSG